MKSLPVDAAISDLKTHLNTNNTVVLQAPPGAGKTTRVPLALLQEQWLFGKKIIMLQPRRIAARHAAYYMAKEIGETVGQTVGYQIRLERKAGQKTKIEVVTEGILTRRLQSNPELSDIGLIIFDEFHERSIHSDLALALSREVQSVLRPDLRILIMSATMDTLPIAKLLDNCPIITSSGRTFEITTKYLPQPEKYDIVTSVIAGLERALVDTDGDILAFLPGAREINQCAEILSCREDLAIYPLYGALSFEKQQQALLPTSKRRIVLATNIAETSLTIEGISTVIDSGWERRPRYDSGQGLTLLELKRISAASAAQRSGRAGRLGPGTCYRLWSNAQQAELLPYPPPEIRVSDLTPLILELANWGENTPSNLIWLDPPSESQIQEARETLIHLGALTIEGNITKLGRRLARLPLLPRLAKLVITAQEKGLGLLGCELAALLNEQSKWPASSQTNSADCDLEYLWKSYFGPQQIAPNQSIRRTVDQLMRSLGIINKQSRWPTDRRPLEETIAETWPDQIARNYESSTRKYHLSNGQKAILSSHSVVNKPLYLVAIQMRSPRGEKEITLAAPLHEDILPLCFKDQFKHHRCIEWDTRSDKITAKERLCFKALTLSEKPIQATVEEQTDATLKAIIKMGTEQLNWSPAALQLKTRVEFCRHYDQTLTWPDMSDAGLNSSIHLWLKPFLAGVTTRTAILQCDLYEPLKSILPWEFIQKMNNFAPERMKVPSGSSIKINYCVEGQPVLAVKLQELFGLKETPRVANGQVPVTIHALSPAGRPLAVTQDLNYFWAEIYPEIRKEMRGRYPKHPWPEDPLQAPATAKTKKQLAKS